MALPLEFRHTRGQEGAPVLVLLHGRGSDERDLGTLGTLIAPGATIVTPRAPFPGVPWGYGPGWAWYRFLSGRTPESETFVEGQRALHDFISGIRDELSLGDIPLIVGGFSQGGTSALAWALQHPGVARAVMVFSGFLAEHPDVRATETSVQGTAIWWGHGTADTMMPYRNAEIGWEALRAAGANLRALPIEGLGHSITREEAEDARQFLRELL